MTVAFVGMGGNLGGAPAVVARFAEALERLRARRVSSIYVSAPIGPVAAQPDFLNAVAELAVDLAPRALLAELLAVEAALGRDRARETPQGPRPLDLDLLLFGERVIAEPDLVVPHPRLHRRAFALRPLAELAGPDLVIPGLGATVGARLADPEVAAQPVRLDSDLVLFAP